MELLLEQSVAKTVLHGWVVQSAENLQVFELVRQLGEQWWCCAECAVLTWYQLGLIKAEMIDDREQAARGIRLGHLSHALHLWEQQGNARTPEEGPPFHGAAC